LFSGKGFLNRSAKIFLLTLIIAGVLNFAFVFEVQAGLFSFFKKIFREEETTVKITPNLQNIHLLESVLNPNFLTGRGGGGITIVNQNSLLPNTGPLGSIVDIESETSNKDKISLYVVREGDTLSQISEMFDVSVNTIVWANNIKRGDLIKPGQTLVILPISGIRHTVVKGETLSSIAKKYNGDIDEIVSYNDLDPAQKLEIGQEIIIPDGEISAPASRYGNTSEPLRGRSYSSRRSVDAGYYLRPINGGARSQGLHGYNAVDLATYCGAPVLAAASGDVIVSQSYGWNGGYGHYIVIKHPNGTQTLYAHNSRNIVTRGWHVVKGQVIGYVGSTGKSTGCHVHFEVRGARNPF
jgi:murein DD-endopeptidase MepM/ murein hydrolase activator NlpD